MNSALIAGMLALGLVTAYVSNLTQQSSSQITKQKREAAQEFSASQNLSSVSLMKSSLDTTKGKSGYGAALYAKDYFATTWNLAINADHQDNKAKLVGASKVDFDLLPESLDPKDLNAVLKGEKNQVAFLNTPSRVEIVKQNRDKVYQTWVRSVDILATRSATKTTPASQIKARINLAPPVPKDLGLLVKAPGSTSFSKNFGTDTAPLKEGTYTFRLIGSGVIHYGQILVDNNPYSIGLDPKTGTVTHKANNVMALNEPLGDVSIVVKAKTSDDKDVGLNGCDFSSSQYSASNVNFQIFHISAKAIGVDGTEAENLRVETKLYVRIPPPAEHNSDKYAKDECRQMCAGDLADVYDRTDDVTRAKFLDVFLDGVSDPKQRDLFNALLTNKMRGRNVKGVICSNMDDDATILLNENGMRPTALQKKNPEGFGQIEWDARHHVRWFAYSAPACERKFVAARNECGCFAEDTLIRMADGSDMPISELKAGDLVLNPQTGLAQPIARITAGPEKIAMLALRVAGETLKVTVTHPFLTKRGLLKAGDLKAGDVILRQDASSVIESIATLEPDPANYPIVWNIALVGQDQEINRHFILANGIMAGDLFLQESLQNPKP